MDESCFRLFVAVIGWSKGLKLNFRAKACARGFWFVAETGRSIGVDGHIVVGRLIGRLGLWWGWGVEWSGVDG